MTDNEFYTFMADTVITGMDDDKNNLAHHGIKGQHWGQRRYQNPDGSLTAAGRKRYESYEQRKKEWAKDPKKVYKHRKDFSTKEIQEAFEKAEAQNKLKEELSDEKRAEHEKSLEKRMHKDQIRQEKTQAKLALEEIQSKERIEIAREKTKVELQKVKDKNQDKRTKKAEEAKKKKEAEERKKLLNRLKKINDWGKTVNNSYDNLKKMFANAGMEKEFDDFMSSLFNKKKKP